MLPKTSMQLSLQSLLSTCGEIPCVAAEDCAVTQVAVVVYPEMRSVV